MLWGLGVERSENDPKQALGKSWHPQEFPHSSCMALRTPTKA